MNHHKISIIYNFYSKHFFTYFLKYIKLISRSDITIIYPYLTQCRQSKTFESQKSKQKKFIDFYFFPYFFFQRRNLDILSIPNWRNVNQCDKNGSIVLLQYFQEYCSEVNRKSDSATPFHTRYCTLLYSICTCTLPCGLNVETRLYVKLRVVT